MDDIISFNGVDIVVNITNFRSSYYTKNTDLTSWTDAQLENVILDAISEVESFIGYPIFTNEVVNERHDVNIDYHGFITVDLFKGPLADLSSDILLKFGDAITVTTPASSWDRYNNGTFIKYRWLSNDVTEYNPNLFSGFCKIDDSYTVDVTYTAGVSKLTNILNKAIMLLSVGYIANESGQGVQTGALKSIKTGNYVESYYNVSTTGESGVKAIQDRVFDMLRREGYSSPGIV